MHLGLLTGKSSEKLRINPRKAWYRNLEEVTPNGDYEVTFRLKRPQPSFIVLLASGFSAVYPCHVPARDMRAHPIGTGPFKFVEFKPNESIKLARNPDYWNEGRPYLDGIEYTIIGNLSTAVLAFIGGKVDMTWPYSLRVPLLKDIRSQVPQAICELAPNNVSSNLIVNRTRRLFRPGPSASDGDEFGPQSVHRHQLLSDGQGDIGGVMQPPPEGIWGMPPDILQTLPGYNPDVAKSRAEARNIMEQLGYGPDNRLKIKCRRGTPPSIVIRR